MELTALLFYLFALVTVGSAVLVVYSRNIVHSAFALMFTLLGVAALYVLLHADFVAATQVLVYVGGILILILFGVMLTTQGVRDKLEEIAVNVIPATLLAAFTGVLLLYVFYRTEWALVETAVRDQTVSDLGHMLLFDYLLPFQAAGVLLLAAIIGALYISTRGKPDDGMEGEGQSGEERQTSESGPKPEIET